MLPSDSRDDGEAPASRGGPSYATLNPKPSLLRREEPDIPASSKPIWTKFKKKDAVLFERRNNSTREVPPDEVDGFIAERFGSTQESA